MGDSSDPGGIPVTRTGLRCTLGPYAAINELFLTELVTGDEAENVKAQMKRHEQIVTSDTKVRRKPPVKLDSPVYFTPLTTDEVWKFTTSWQRLSGRAGYALMRDGVMICEIITVMA